MSNRKSIVVLVIMFVLLLAANLTLRFRQVEPRPRAALTLLKPSATYDRLIVERRGLPPTELVRGDTWRFAAPYVGEADGQAVARLLDVLSFTRVTDVVANSELIRLGRTRADFSLSDPLVRIVARSQSGDETAISFGMPTPSADGIYAAVSTLDAVLVVPSEMMSEVDRPADGYRRRALFDCDSSDVLSLDVKCARAAALSFVRKDGGWELDGMRASTRELEKYLSELVSSAALDFVWPVGVSNETSQVSSSLLSTYGLDPDSAVTVVLKVRDGSSRQVVFGKGTDAAHVYACIRDGGAVATVPVSLKDQAERAASLFTDVRPFPVEASSVAGFTVTDADVVYALAREGDGWRLESPISAPADAAFVEKAVERILALSRDDVAPDGKGVAVCLTTNVPPVILSPEKVVGAGRLEDFRSREVIRIEADQVRRLVCTKTNGKAPARTASVVYDRDRRAWNVESSDEDPAAADGSGIRTVLEGLCPLRAIRIEKIKVSAADLDDYGLDRPFLTLAVDLEKEGAGRRNVLIGGATSGGHFATVGSSDAVFVVSDKAVSALLSPLVAK